MNAIFAWIIAKTMARRDVDPALPEVVAQAVAFIRASAQVSIEAG